MLLISGNDKFVDVPVLKKEREQTMLCINIFVIFRKCDRQFSIKMNNSLFISVLKTGKVLIHAYRCFGK